MKKILFASLLVGMAAFSFTSCEDDRDSNPTVQQPESFVLNTPALAGNVYDLQNCDSIEFTYVQPDYGYTAPVSYYIQVSVTDEWSNTEIDENGEVVELAMPKFVELDGFVTVARSKASAEQINKSILKMRGYAEEEVPEMEKVFVRMRAVLYSGYECYSNSVELTVHPYYQALTAADPELWYLVGGCIADASWGGTIGTATYPLCPVAGAEYDDETGKGPLTYTGYFPTGLGFKIIKTPGVWDENEWGGIGGDIAQPHLKASDGEAASDFKVTEAGYYRIDLDTKKNEMTITKVDAPAEYTEMYISGDFNGWDENTLMTPADTYEGVTVNHVWVYELSSSVDTTVKFLRPGWNPNWGGTDFPYGWGVSNGANIPVPAGDYTILFNDVTGYYHFYSK